MNIREYIESGILELYIFGRLSDAENEEVRKMEQQHHEVHHEIVAIEKAVINLSYSMAPYLSTENYEKIREQLIEKHTEAKVVDINRKPKSNILQYVGWAAAVLLLFGLIFQSVRYNEAVAQNEKVSAERGKFEQMLAMTEKKNTQNEKALAILRDRNTVAVPLAGQQAAPEAYARVYHNNQTQQVYVDAAGLPEPPKGYVYQVWALKLDPLTPTSVGLIENADAGSGLYPVEYFGGAEGYGITLEPAGGSPTPTLEKLFTLGKV